MVLAAKAVKDGEADAVLSAGTGALWRRASLSGRTDQKLTDQGCYPLYRLWMVEVLDMLIWGQMLKILSPSASICYPRFFLCGKMFVALQPRVGLLNNGN